ncbi:hypothetical protein [Ornithinibacillus xuwenensis]|uniref:Uncharacterized protein n=1 Tax=Ornithinibacillus xuwenensis TaxID=3144668 RepID=A0ABU9XI20_9BACI
MNENILTIAENIQQDYGLNDYVLKRNTIYSETTLANQTSYILSLEWVPSSLVVEDADDYNPSGSAILEIDLHTQGLKRINFVQDTSYANEEVFPSPQIENVIEWVEEKTGMMFGRQFKLVHEDGRDFSFHATVDNIDVAPSGSIDVTFNENEQLTSFSIDGVFPTEDQINWEPLSITKEAITDELLKHFTLVETPYEHEEAWLNLWHMKQFYVLNDLSRTIYPESVFQLDTFIDLDVVMEWETAQKKEFYPEEVDFSTDISYEDAIAKKTVKSPITDEELQTSIDETRSFLSCVYTDDSGRWLLTGMYPEKGFIIAELTSIQDSKRALQRKVKVIINRNTYRVANYWDSKIILDRFMRFKEAQAIDVNQETAFNMIKDAITITPVYVKESNSDRYLLCGRVDCDDVIDASSGNKIHLNDL